MNKTYVQYIRYVLFISRINSKRKEKVSYKKPKNIINNLKAQDYGRLHERKLLTVDTSQAANAIKTQEIVSSSAFCTGPISIKLFRNTSVSVCSMGTSTQAVSYSPYMHRIAQYNGRTQYLHSYTY